MTSKIFIASKSPIPNEQHLYLVFDADGNAGTTGDQEVIRGGPEFDPIPLIGQIEIENGEAIADSVDDYGPGEDYTDRNFTELNLATSADDAWTAMQTAVSNLGTTSGDIVTTDIDYYILGPNSNSVITTILYHVGIDIADQRPLWGGSGDLIPLPTFTGANNYMGTDGNDTWDITPTYPKAIYDQGGDDTYTIDVAALPANGTGALAPGLSTCVETLPRPISMRSHNKTVSKHRIRE